MKILGQTNDIQLYDVVQVYEYCSHYRAYKAAQLHVNCGFSFQAKWLPGSDYRIDEGDEYNCPRCGRRLMRRIARRGWASDYFYVTKNKSSTTPVVIKLRAVEHKYWVDLEVKYKAVQCVTNKADGFSLEVMAQEKTCIIRADIKRQRIQLIDREIGHKEYVHDVDILQETDWPYQTPLGYLKKESRIRLHKSEVMKVFTAWRHAIESRIQKKLHYRVSSMYVGTSLRRKGLLFEPLLNIAWRLEAPTAKVYEYANWINLPKGDGDNLCAVWGNVLMETRKGMEYATAVCKAYRLPDKPSIRKYLRESPVFQAVVLKAAMNITSNIDNLIRITSALGTVPFGLWGEKNVMQFLVILARRYGEPVVIKLLEAKGMDARRELIDMARMYAQLSREHRKMFWEGTPVKTRNLHDAVMVLHDREQIEKQEIVLSDTAKMLQQRIGNYEFYTPTDTHQLIDISKELHNCVKSYAGRCVNQLCIIVGVRYHGKIMACIEIRKGEICQAKLIRNQPAYKDEIFNQILILWAERHQLKISKNDMMSPNMRMRQLAV
ncbi:PcfJ domain-containing protein [uncultured Megasphaera sp.]|uniref:PcfJ domain-containing protein n=1 Tax=uncultured Megasphaera sp. TaxID=165188 RepID=UPI00266D129B|nr:PcfJ domain-containing protein [uncultured Megasphaera sp.]